MNLRGSLQAVARALRRQSPPHSARRAATAAWRRFRRQGRPSRIELSSCSLYYEVAGQGEPLILLHGMTGSSRTWLPTMRWLGSRFRVYSIDLVGFGRTRGPAFGGLAQAAGCVEELMDHHGIARASLIGHSMGALVASRLASRHPERVRRLVMIAPPVGAQRRSLGRHARELATGILTVPLMLLPTLLVDVTRAGPMTLWRAARDLLALEADDSLAALSVPTLLVWGEDDTVVPPTVGRRLQEIMPSSRLVIMPDAGHTPMWDRPRQFNRLMSRFLEGDERGAEAADQGTPR